MAKRMSLGFEEDDYFAGCLHDSLVPPEDPAKPVVVYLHGQYFDVDSLEFFQALLRIVHRLYNTRFQLWTVLNSILVWPYCLP